MHVTPANVEMGGVKPSTSEPPAARSRTHTLRGATKPMLEPPPNIDAAPSGERLKPALPSDPTQAFEHVAALTSTAVQGGWGADPTDKNATEPARWSERCDRVYPEASAPRSLSETLREYEPRQRADSTLRMSLLRSAVDQPRVEAPRTTSTKLHGTLVTASIVMALLAIVFAARLPVSGQSSARGVLHSSLPGEPLVAPVSGIVREVPLRAGARFTAGRALVVIDPVDVRAQLAEQLQRIAQIEQRQKAQQERHVVQQRALDALRAQARTLRKRYDGDAQRMARLREQRRSYERLVQHGFASPGGLDNLTGLMQGAWREILAGEQEIANNKQQQLALEQERTRAAQTLQTELKAALAARRSLEAALEHSTLLAPAPGRFDELKVKVGQRVEAGQVLARMLPLDASMRATLEVSSPEHVRLRVGSAATLTIDEPGMDTWSLDGRISTIHVLSELKHAADGAVSPTTTLRVEVELSHQADEPHTPRQLASGTHVSATLSTVPRPLVSAAFEEWSSFMETL